MADIPSGLAKEFRIMLMRVARQLKEEEMADIGFEEGFPHLLEPPPGSNGFKSIRVHFLHKLEASGLFSPLNPDGLIAILKRIPRDDVIDEVIKYKQNPAFLKVTQKSKEKSKKDSKKGKKNDAKNAEENRAGIVSELRAISTENPREHLQNVFAILMTHSSSLMGVIEEVRELMELPLPPDKLKDIPPKLEEALLKFSEEEESVESLGRSMRKVLSDSGLSLSSKSKKQASTESRGETKGTGVRGNKLNEGTGSLPRNMHSVHYKKLKGTKEPLVPPGAKAQSPISSRRAPGISPQVLASEGKFAHLFQGPKEDKTQLVTGHEKTTKNRPPPGPMSPKPQHKLKRQPLQPPKPLEKREGDYYDDVDFTGGTGDSGVGDLKDWAPGSPFVKHLESKTSDGIYETICSNAGEYMDLLASNRNGIAEYTQPNYTTSSTS